MPRFSAIYDLMGDGRTAIKFAASRYDQPINISINQRLNPVGTTSDSRPWTACTAGKTSGCDLNGDLNPQLNELGVSTGFTFGTTNRYDTDLKWPVSNEYSIELQRQLLANTVLSVGYTNRQTRRNIGFRNMAVPIETYIPLQVTEVNSGKQVTVYNQAPALRGRVDNLYFNTDTANSDYNGADVNINKRLSNKWALNGGMSFGKTLGDTLNQDLNNPNSAQFRRGLLGNDSPWSYRMSGVYQLPRDVFVSGTWQYLPGLPGDDDRCGGQQHRDPHTGQHDAHGRTARHDAPAADQFVRLQREKDDQSSELAIRAARRFLQYDERSLDYQSPRAARSDLRPHQQHSARRADQDRVQCGVLKLRILNS